MMEKFVKFNEAARLYAENSAVVDKMYEVFLEDINKFLDSLREEIGVLVAPAVLQEKKTQAYRYWWIDNGDSDKNAYAQLWFDTRLPEIIVPGELHLTAITEDTSEERIEKFVNVATQLVTFCKPGSGGQWSLFTATVSYSEENPVVHAAKPIAKVLKALHEV